MSTKKTHCNECGENAGEADRYCGNCGAELANNQEQETPPVSDGAGQTAGATRTPQKEKASMPVAVDLPTKEGNVVPRRIGAIVIDTFLVMILGVILGVVIASVIQPFRALFVITYFTLYPLYFAVIEAKTSRTPGKAMMDLTVVTKDGAQINSIQSIIRNIVRLVDGFFYYLLGFIIIISSDNNQRLGDIAANTYVVRESRLSDADVLH